MRFYNTLTRQKDEFVPLKPGKASMYVCGPTVYNLIHIGNARPLVVFDTLRRYLEYRGYQVSYVSNYTDIDDKIIKRANEEGVDFRSVSERFIKEYETDSDGLNVKPVTFRPRATECIGDIIAIIGSLMEKGFAYESNGDVYFSPQKFGEYGKLSHMPLEDLEAGARIDVSEQKRDPMDFALWKRAKENEPSWDSPWGKGRPGWHIECSAMSRKFLGETIDIHGGGMDLIFPHHENEIAQSECATGHPLAHYWLHNGHINVDNRKMSKSLGNFFTVREVAAKVGYEPIRYMMVAVQYRSPMNYSLEVVEQAQAGLERLYTCRGNLDFALRNAPEAPQDGDAALLELAESRRQQFIAAMDDDLNTADGLSALFELARDINSAATGGALPSRAALAALSGAFNELADVLGLLYNKADDSLDSGVEALIERRQAARKAKDFKTADLIRDKLKAMGIVLEDTPQGVKWRKE